MSRLVQKFGGTSVATIERIKHVAEIIAENRLEKKEVVAVVSAMAGVTNKFVEYMRLLNTFEGDAEYDSVVSSGELVTAGLLAVALKNMGLRSRSYAGWQVPIVTSSRYGSAVIQSVDASCLEKDLAEGVIPVVCGFQGINNENRVTTLGRGGSDLTAVAVSDAVHAELCEIYSDVDGVYTVDPNLYLYARRLPEINYEEMSEMAAYGAKVLQEQSVSYAMEKNVRIRVASSFIKTEGTIICGDCHREKFCGLAITRNLAQLKVQCRSDFNRDIEELLRRNFIRCEIVRKNSDTLSVFADRAKITAVKKILSGIDGIISVKSETNKRHCSCISVIGYNLSENDLKQLTSALSSAQIEVFYCSVSKYRINLLLAAECLLKAIDILHKCTELDKENVR